ncbi:MAG: ATP-dependent helicase HrpB [Deltaproteobacteria bacterium]|nr:ATP-dependent helicase HrpB [Deltaproteobacteria bacterium]
MTTATDRPALPIDPLLPHAVAALADRGVLVLTAEPGAGKTTRVPPALLEADVFAGECWVVQPRRMAAVLSARRVAHERGERCGAAVGYTVRLDESVSPATRLRFVTDGILVRRLLADPTLAGIGALVFDEFHERRAAMDLCLAVARRLRATRRPDLRLAVMSATLDAPAVAAWLGDAPVVDAPGRVFPVDISHDAQLDSRRLEDQVASAIRRALDRHADGNVLAFLPGAGEIRRVQTALGAQRLGDVVVAPLHGSLPLHEQEAAVAPSAVRKIILATNIAETSLTLPGVVAVVDSGLARSAGFATWSGLATLQLTRISRASATQRAGRAGRVRPGTCHRLYTRFDHDQRPAFDTPELLRTDLAEPALLLASLPAELQPGPEDGFWLDPPPPAGLDQARAALLRMAAIEDAQGTALTAVGRNMLRWPLPPRLARVAVAGAELGIATTAARAAGLLAERDLRQGGARSPHFSAQGHSDVAQLLLDAAACERGAHPRDRDLDPAGWQVARRALGTLTRLAVSPDRSGVDVDSALGLALLAGFGDRLAKRRSDGSADLELPGGASVRMGSDSHCTLAQWVVVVDAEERRDGKQRATWVRIGHGVEPEQVFLALADRVATTAVLALEGKRAVAREETRCDGLLLEARSMPVRPGPDVAQLLVSALRKDGFAGVLDRDETDTLRQRVAFARQAGGLGELPALDDAAVDQAIYTAALPCVRLDQFAAADVLGHLRAALDQAYSGQGLRRLEAAAPEAMALPGGRKLRIHYEADKPPWTQSRMQDFFGLADGPKVAFGAVPVVLHLLAPNQRPVQVTTDLAGFWQRHWPAIRRELCRKYPRHLWPEDPAHAAPPPPHRPR